MKQLIHASNFKLKRNRTIKVAAIVTICIVVLLFLLFYGTLHILTDSILVAAGGEESDLAAFDNINLLDCAAIALSLMQILSIILAIAITGMISGERKTGVYSLMAAKGFTRGQIYANKLYEAMVVTLILYLCYICASLLIGGILWHGKIEAAMVAGFFKILFLLLFMYMAAACLFLAIAINVKNGGAAVAINLLLLLIISAGITGLDTSLWGDAVILRKWWIFSAIEQFAYLEITGEEIIIAFANILIYGGAAVFIGKGVFSRTELN